MERNFHVTLIYSSSYTLLCEIHMECRVSTSRDVYAALSSSAVFASDIGCDSLPISCLISYCLHEIDITSACSEFI